MLDAFDYMVTNSENTMTIIAQDMDISFKTLYRLRVGDTPMTLDYLFKAVKVLGYDRETFEYLCKLYFLALTTDAEYYASRLTTNLN